MCTADCENLGSLLMFSVIIFLNNKLVNIKSFTKKVIKKKSTIIMLPVSNGSYINPSKLPEKEAQ